MRIKHHPGKHLTYCTNIHPGERWNEVFNQLKTNIPQLKQRISPSAPFGIGLRLSADAAAQLLKDDHLDSFKKWLQYEELYVFTINGFPYGNFHRQRVKDLVYKPDWRTQKRVNYTMNLVTILAELLPEKMDGGISTSPISYKYWFKDDSLIEATFKQASKNLAHIAQQMHQIKNDQDKELHLDIEPEPDCLLENTQETIDFFTKWLLPEGSLYLSATFGYTEQEALNILKNHIQVCYDTCHFAVEYENPSDAIMQFKEAGIKIGKTQISSALNVELNTQDQRETVKAKLKNFEESTYLHQVIERRTDGTLCQYRDLGEALPHIYNTNAETWRIHYHVPIFIDDFETICSTQDDIKNSLDVLLDETECTHFEVETYTWEVLPQNLKVDLLDSIERELHWVIDYVN